MPMDSRGIDFLYASGMPEGILQTAVVHQCGGTESGKLYKRSGKGTSISSIVGVAVEDRNRLRAM